MGDKVVRARIDAPGTTLERECECAMLVTVGDGDGGTGATFGNMSAVDVLMMLNSAASMAVRCLEHMTGDRDRATLLAFCAFVHGSTDDEAMDGMGLRDLTADASIADLARELGMEVPHVG